MLDLSIDLLIGVTALAVAWFGYQEFTSPGAQSDKVGRTFSARLRDQTKT